MLKRIGSETIGSLFWVGVGGFFAIEGVRLGVRTMRNPGPGFLPVIMALLLIFFSLLILIKGLMNPAETVVRVSWKRHAWVIAVVFLYIFLLDGFGFLLSTFVLMFMLFSLLFKGKNRWRTVLFYSLVTALSAWLLFEKVARMPFPEPRLFGI
jgi:putative tricarboxylic transport membrane protein